MTLNQQSLAFAVVGPHAQHHLFTPYLVEALIFQQATMVLPIRRQACSMNAPHVKHGAANFKDDVEEAVEPVELWVHTAAAVEI